ncbi:MAG: hypothetical protein JW746_03070 [Candidatus Krumholzibacteriota bacterium]|nr:hypothetical protein [Candidatus Krumholzibacteriota bacterium]
MQRKTFIIFFTVVTVSLVVSGTACSQSVFGMNFIGEHRFGGNARTAALGYSGIALTDTSSAITMNPASLSDLSRVTFSLFELLSFSRIERTDIQSNRTRFQIPSAAVAVPLHDGLVFSLGYRTRFAGKDDFSIQSEIEDLPAVNENYKLNSSLFSVPFILAWKPVDWLRVSGEFQLERGSIKDQVSVSIEDPLYSTATSSRTRSFSSGSWAVSMLMRVHPRLWVGGSYDESIDYTVSEITEYSLESLNESSTWDFSLPAAFSAGFAAGVTDRWWLTGSYWERQAPEPDGFPQFEGALGDENLFAVGVERRSAAEGGAISRIPLRIGFYRNRWHMEFPQGEPVVSSFFTVGSGFSVPGGPGDLDLTLEFGKIGSVENNKIDEKVFRLGISINFSEVWSRRKIVRH